MGRIADRPVGVTVVLVLIFFSLSKQARRCAMYVRTDGRKKYYGIQLCFGDPPSNFVRLLVVYRWYWSYTYMYR